MNRLKILTVVGARPQFIKAATLSRVLAGRRMTEIMVHTGQHFDPEMSEIFFRELNIPEPAYHLEVHGGGHGEMTGRMLQALEPVMQKAAPDAVVVFGDTNSTAAGALCAAKLQIPIAHVEAGLRSFDRRMPEEINRVVADHLSDILLCPSRTAVKNLAKEGITQNVHHVGDVMYDAALHARTDISGGSHVLDRLKLAPRGYAVATVHRAENTDDPVALAKVIGWLVARSEQHPVVLPLHPRTRQALARDNLALKGVRVIDPVGYLDMMQLMKGAVAVYTDSGGMQKEAYFHRVPCITLRANTEWVETIEAGWNRLWEGPDYVKPRRDIDDFGDGRAADSIVDIIADKLRSRA